MAENEENSYVSVFADISNTHRAERPELFERFERLLSESQNEEDNEELITKEFVKHLRQEDNPTMLAWQAVWYENNGRNLFGSFYHSPYGDEAVDKVSYVRPLDMAQKPVQVVDVTYYLPNGLPFHADFKYQAVDYEAPYN